MTNTSIIPVSQNEMSLADLGTTLAKSGFFADTREASQAIVKVLAGREIGFGPVASMTGIYIVKGRVSLSANLMAAAVRRSGRYTYLVRELTEKNASIEFFEIIGGKRETLGISAFSLDDAKRAGTQNIDKFARNMLFARAMSNGVKWYCPDVTGGPVYTPEELEERVNEDGEIIDARPAPVVTQAPTPAPVAPAPTTWVGKVASLTIGEADREAVRDAYATLVAVVTKANEGVPPYTDPPTSRANAIARCREMAPVADAAQNEVQS